MLHPIPTLSGYDLASTSKDHHELHWYPIYNPNAKECDVISANNEYQHQQNKKLSKEQSSATSGLDPNPHRQQRKSDFGLGKNYN